MPGGGATLCARPTPLEVESRMPRIALPLLLLASLAAPAQADTCEALKSQIESKIKAGGVASFSLSVVAASAPAAGKVVGTCGLGTKKIVYSSQAGASAVAPVAPVAPLAAAAPARRRSTADSTILTECKDGSMSVGATCK
jgi:hypothetical protein